MAPGASPTITIQDGFPSPGTAFFLEAHNSHALQFLISSAISSSSAFSGSRPFLENAARFYLLRGYVRMSGK
jgi:hypothetical protein